MFGGRYFSKRMFAGRYFPPNGAGNPGDMSAMLSGVGVITSTISGYAYILSTMNGVGIVSSADLTYTTPGGGTLLNRRLLGVGL